MAARAVWLLLAIPAVPLLCLQLRSAGFNPVTEEENKRRQKRVREEQQETLSNQSSAYLKRVLKPRQEMKLRKREERFYQMTGETWKSLAGHKLRGHEEPRLANEYRAPRDIPNREASKRRRLPEPLSPVSASPVQSRAKKVVSVALRCPDGRVLRRRFYKTCSSQVLWDWMMKVGYHSSIYTLSTSYPRRPLEVGQDQTLEDTGLTMDTVLNVEEKEPSLSL
ncbi:UBX domain-containing protein 8 isoform X7 [Notamacropus eugenii]|uniref:UBX domain-containing protein 8 isoform X7 n=1 Tax=Notamacropus eugenii TaxID=9315 RepID=UPI003B66F237